MTPAQKLAKELGISTKKFVDAAQKAKQIEVVLPVLPVKVSRKNIGGLWVWTIG